MNLLRTAPEQSRSIVGSELFSRAVASLPEGMRVRFAVSDAVAWRSALGPEAEIVECAGGSLWRYRWWEAVYTQLLFPLRFMGADRVFSISPIFPVALLSRNVVMVHDVAYLRYPEEASLPARLYLRLMYWCAARFARRIVTISRFSAREIAEAYGVPEERISVLYNSVPALERVSDEEAIRVADRVSGGAPYFLYVGITRYRKNLPTLLRAFSLLSKERPDVKLVLVGKIDTRFADVGALARELGIGDRVVQTGFVSLEEKAALMQRAIALVQTSLYEGFGLQVIEGQRMGLPVIAAGIPAFVEVAGGAALFVDDPMDASGFADAMGRLMDDASLARDLVARGAGNYGRFSWEENVAPLVKILAD